ncbi:MAG: PilZ domain-containing protein [Thermodesulfobacteriota bacterium]
MKKEKGEKRAFPRGKLLRPLVYTIAGLSQKGYISDLSKGGCHLYIYSDESFPLEIPFEIELRLENFQDPIQVQAKAVREGPFLYQPYPESPQDINREIGIQFLLVTERDNEWIRRYC